MRRLLAHFPRPSASSGTIVACLAVLETTPTPIKRFLFLACHIFCVLPHFQGLYAKRPLCLWHTLGARLLRFLGGGGRLALLSAVVSSHGKHAAAEFRFQVTGSPGVFGPPQGLGRLPGLLAYSKLPSSCRVDFGLSFFIAHVASFGHFVVDSAVNFSGVLPSFLERDGRDPRNPQVKSTGINS